MKFSILAETVATLYRWTSHTPELFDVLDDIKISVHHPYL